MKAMRFIAAFGKCAIVLREFFAPRYHPERHYMRGPGPACARRHHEGRDPSIG